jgi:hypothetical protein
VANCFEHLKVTHYTKPFIQDLLDLERPKRAKQTRRKAVIGDLKEDLAVCRSTLVTAGRRNDITPIGFQLDAVSEFSA